MYNMLLKCLNFFMIYTLINQLNLTTFKFKNLYYTTHKV